MARTPRLLPSLAALAGVAAAGYLSICGWMYVKQRELMYFPQNTRLRANTTDYTVDRGDIVLRGWRLNPGRDKALIYFGGNLPMTLNERDKPLGWNWTYWERALRPVIEEIGDKSPLAAALCAPESKLPIKVNGDGIEFCVREFGGDVFVLACSRSPLKTAEVEFSGLPDGVSTGEVLYEPPRTIQVKGGAFKDWFAPWDVHVYKFSRGPAGG